MSYAAAAVFLVGTLSFLGCGGSKSSPTAPTPQIAQVGGVWRVTETVTSVTGGECFASAFR